MKTRLLALVALPFIVSQSSSAPPPSPAARQGLRSEAREKWRNVSSALRTTDAATAKLVRQGLERSSILRSLVTEIESAHVVVYVVRDGNMRDSLAGGLNFLGQGGRYRYVRVSINREQPDTLFIASLAHELQHVREIVADPDVHDAASLQRLYRRIGDQNFAAGTLAWDTEAARRIGYEVRREIRAAARQER